MLRFDPWLTPIGGNLTGDPAMRVERIETHEHSFARRRRDSRGRLYRLLRKTIEIPGEDAEMRYVDVKPADGDESYFYRTKNTKAQIVLHFTTGYLKGDLATLTQVNHHVSVPFLIARNGTIYNLFPSTYWSYHLGRSATGGNRERSRASIGIELSNIGPLTWDADRLVTIYSTVERKDVYCEMDQPDAYVKTPFRDRDYFATVTDAQYEALVIVLRYATARYQVPRKFLPVSERYDTDAGTAHFKGIVSHVNFRARDKWDIGPAFDWDRVLQAVRA